MRFRPIAPIVVAALLTAACGGGTAATTTTTTTSAAPATIEPVEVFSADGTASVVIQDGSTGVTIEPIDPATLGLPDDLTTYGAYELGPSGFDGGAVVTVETGVPWGEQLPVMVGLLGTDEGWEVLHTAAVGSTDGMATIAFEVPHFSPLVIVGSSFAIDLDPPDVFASVGEHWDVYWDLVDPTTRRITNGPAMRGFFYDIESDADLISTVRPLLDEVDVVVSPRTSGAVANVPGQDSGGTYAYEPTTGYHLQPAAEGPLTEVFYGYDTFTCVSPGTGFFGFTIDVVVDRSDLLIGARFGDRLALVNPRDGVEIQYDVAGKATCDEHPYVPLARFLQQYQALSPDRVARVLQALKGDTGPGIYSISRTMPGGFIPRVDLWEHTGFRYEEPDRLRLDLTYNYSVFECGESRMSPELNGLMVTTICSDDVAPIEAGGVVIVTATYMDTLPGPGSGEYYTYAAVFDSNGDPADDWQYQGPYDWDFYQGADRWYQANWDPVAQRWSLAVSDGLDPFGPSGARAIVIGDTIVWVIPASEFASQAPAYRVTSFVHDGTFAPETSGGDVSGDDPTEALIPITDLDR